jgi:hypothetical protein
VVRDNPLRRLPPSAHASTAPEAPLSTAVPSRTPPPDRYGRAPSRARRLALLAGIGLLAVLGLAWVVWAGLGQASADVRWTDLGYRVIDDSRVTVTYDVGKDPGATAVCSLRAIDQYKSAVGITRVTIGPTRERVTRRTDPVRTSARAVTGVVQDCGLRR